jgi:trehalose-phosphatase
MPTLKPLLQDLVGIATRLRSAATVAVGCDYDGTLTPIADHPDLAVLPPRTRQALDRIATAPGMSLAVVSGRRVDDIGSKLGLERVFLGGLGGLETLDLHARHELHIPPGRELPPELEPILTEWCQRFQGAWIESKGAAFSVHFRAVAPREQPAFCSGTRRRVARFAGRAHVVLGKKVFDVLPRIEWDKAAAIRMWLESLAPPDLIFYFGDDTLDEPVHAYIAQRGGYAVAIGRLASRAKYSLATPDEVVWFLEWLENEWARLTHEAPGARRRRQVPIA